MYLSKTTFFIVIIFLLPAHAMSPCIYQESGFSVALQKALLTSQHYNQNLALFFCHLLALEVPHDSARSQDFLNFLLKLRWLKRNSHYIKDLPQASQNVAWSRLNALSEAADTARDTDCIRLMLHSIRLNAD